MQIERKIQRFDFSIFPNLIFKNFPLPRGLESHALEFFFLYQLGLTNSIFGLYIRSLRTPFSEPWTGYLVPMTCELSLKLG